MKRVFLLSSLAVLAVAAIPVATTVFSDGHGGDGVVAATGQQHAIAVAASDGQPSEARPIVEGIGIDPTTLKQEGVFSWRGEVRRVFTGRKTDGGLNCVVVRRGSSAHDGADSCARNLFEKAPVSLLELFSASAEGELTSYELAGLAAPNVKRVSVIDSTGRSVDAEVTGRSLYFALAPEDLAAGISVKRVEARSATGELVATLPIRTAP